MNYTLEQVKSAFWKTFHHSGEKMFLYPEMGVPESECEQATNQEWEEFLNVLKTVE